MAWDKYVAGQIAHLKSNPQEMEECKKIENEAVDKIESMFQGMRDYTWWESVFGTVYDADKHMSTRAEYVKEAQEIMNTIVERGGKLDFMPSYFRYHPRAESMAKKITELNVKNPAERDLLVANVAKEREIQYLTGVVKELNGKYNTLSTLLIPTLLHTLTMLDDKDRELQLSRQDDIWLMLAVLLEASRRRQMYAMRERDEFEAKLTAQEKVIEDLERVKIPRDPYDDPPEQPRPLVERCSDCNLLKLIEHRDIANLWIPRAEREASTSRPTTLEPEAALHTPQPRTSTPKPDHVPPTPPPNMLDCSESFEEWNFEDAAFEGIAALNVQEVDAVLTPAKEDADMNQDERHIVSSSTDLPVSTPFVVTPWSPCYNRRDIPDSPTRGTEGYLLPTPTIEEEDDDVICLEGYVPPFEQPTTTVYREEIVNSPQRARRDLLTEFRPDTPYRRRSTRLLKRKSPKSCH
ncbi:uncharacterized protein LOC121417331 [Lytechinus variegatus]|nr:uncharacterized protein LOC121417331 [Lytechinus variegatus]